MTVALPPSAAPLRALPADAVPGHVAERLAGLAGGAEPVSAYLYDVDAAARHARDLRLALPQWAEMYYAVKANSFPPVLTGLLAGVTGIGRDRGVDGFEVASAGEIDLAVRASRQAGRPVRLIATGPGKSVPLLAALVAAGAEVINVESVLELHRLDRIAAEAGCRVPVALRVNPAYVPVTGSLHMGGAATQFGIPEADVPEALRIAARLPHLDPVGFHIHAVCNNLDAAAHVAYVRHCLEWSACTAARHGVDLRVVDVGGGIGVAFEGEEPFDLAVFADRMTRVRPPAGVRVVFEPGRWLVAGCGFYAAEVTDLKHAYGTWFAVLRGGINHFQLPTSWDIVHNFTVVPVRDWPYACPRPEVREAPVTVVGELCTPEDTLARDITVERIRAGDLVVFPNAGSYGWEFAMHEFLGHPRAQRIALGDAGATESAATLA